MHNEDRKGGRRDKMSWAKCQTNGKHLKIVTPITMWTLTREHNYRTGTINPRVSNPWPVVTSCPRIQSKRGATLVEGK